MQWIQKHNGKTLWVEGKKDDAFKETAIAKGSKFLQGSLNTVTDKAVI